MRKRLLIVGSGDVVARALPDLAEEFSVLALARRAERIAQLARYGIRTQRADLDQPESLRAAIEPAACLLHCAPPPSGSAAETQDTRTRNLLAALTELSQKAPGMVPRRVVYVSTSGVYGDCAGEWVDEARPARPVTARARRRVDAEGVLARWCERHAATLITLRAPGIYAPGRLPLERLRQRIPVLRREDDVYTNHIHADDLARICVRALREDAPPGIYNASDDEPMLMGDWMDCVADRYGLPRPARVSRAEAGENIGAERLSFMSESRRLVNTRLKFRLKYTLLYPTATQGLKAAFEERSHGNAGGIEQPAQS